MMNIKADFEHDCTFNFFLYVDHVYRRMKIWRM